MKTVDEYIKALPLDVIGEIIRRIPVDKYIEHYEKARKNN